MAAAILVVTGCASPAAQPRPPAPPVVANGELDYRLPPGWSDAYKLQVFPIAERSGDFMNSELEVLWQTHVTPRFQVAQPSGPYRRRLASGYALAYDHVAPVSLYVIYTDDRYIAILATGLTVAADPALAKLFDSMSIRGVPPSKTPLFDNREMAGRWSTLSMPLATSEDPDHPSNALGEELELERGGHFNWYATVVSESGRPLRKTDSGRWSVHDDTLVMDSNGRHVLVKRRIWAVRDAEAMTLATEDNAQPPFFNPADAINPRRFTKL